jgi:hypothetical protein
MMRQLSQKSDTYTESLTVDVTGISVKVSAHYPGRSLILPLVLSSSRGDEIRSEKSAEVILGSSTKNQRTELKLTGEDLSLCLRK